ncbi:MAG: serine/threonine-protein kinase [Acidobacteria bacterium]|nr:serine/threonine-protein kinase [Acidobacteriota bacterium]
MGEVYKARDTRLHRSVAIKVVRVDKGDGPEDHRRLEREARAAAALKHRHICTIHDVGVHDGQPFIVMEYLEGGSLSQHLGRDGLGLGLDALLRYATQIADALAHAHARGVIHRDLKASNVVFDAGGEPKVLDFGLAKRVSDPERAAATATDVVTRTTDELIAGTLPYMAPEVLRGDPADERSDIWSLGVLVSRMASGRLPFTGATASETIAAILRDPPLPLPSSLPRGLQAVVARCLAKERMQRYERASEVRAALETTSVDALEGPGATEVREIRRLGPFTNATPAAPDASGPLSSRQDERNRDSESLQKIASRLDVVAGVARLAIGGAVAMLVLGVLGFVTSMTFNLALQIPSIPSVADSLIFGGRAMIPVAFWMLLDGAAVAVVLGALRLLAPLVKPWSFGTGHRRPGWPPWPRWLHWPGSPGRSSRQSHRWWSSRPVRRPIQPFWARPTRPITPSVPGPAPRWLSASARAGWHSSARSSQRPTTAGSSGCSRS